MFRRRTALHCAAYVGSVECCSILIDRGAPINSTDNEGISPLHWACSGGHIMCVQYLMGMGAYPNTMEGTDHRFTPLDYAILGEHQDLAQWMIEQGAITISSIQELAAIVIQKVVRGFLARRKVAGLKAEKPLDVTDGERERAVPSSTPRDRLTSVPQHHYLQWCVEEVWQYGALSYYVVCRDLKERLAEAERQEAMLKSASSVTSCLILFLLLSCQRALQGKLARRDQQRMIAFREKTKAALIIQLAWRK